MTTLTTIELVGLILASFTLGAGLAYVWTAGVKPLLDDRWERRFWERQHGLKCEGKDKA